MTVSGGELVVRPLLAGSAAGTAVVLTEPLSFWGGVDASTGDIVDPTHPAKGARTTGRILVMPAGRGSSSSSSVLAEAIRIGTAPAAILLEEPDEILVLGAMVAQLLYGKTCPMAEVPRGHGVETGDEIELAGDVLRTTRGQR